MQNNANIRRRNTASLVALAVLLFVIATALHIAWGWFPKSIDVMPDEMRYLDTARSLFCGDGLVLRGDPSTFQKILYPLAIMPALLFPDGPTQVQAINVLNSIYACSTVFPASVSGGGANGRMISAPTFSNGSSSRKAAVSSLHQNTFLRGDTHTVTKYAPLAE